MDAQLHRVEAVGLGNPGSLGQEHGGTVHVVIEEHPGPLDQLAHGLGRFPAQLGQQLLRAVGYLDPGVLGEVVKACLRESLLQELLEEHARVNGLAQVVAELVVSHPSRHRQCGGSAQQHRVILRRGDDIGPQHVIVVRTGVPGLDEDTQRLQHVKRGLRMPLDRDGQEVGEHLEPQGTVVGQAHERPIPTDHHGGVDTDQDLLDPGEGHLRRSGGGRLTGCGRLAGLGSRLLARGHSCSCR